MQLIRCKEFTSIGPGQKSIKGANSIGSQGIGNSESLGIGNSSSFCSGGSIIGNKPSNSIIPFPNDWSINYNLDGTDIVPVLQVGTELFTNGQGGTNIGIIADAGISYDIDADTSKIHGAENGSTFFGYFDIITELGGGKLILQTGSASAGGDGLVFRLSNDNKVQVASNNNYALKGSTAVNDGKRHWGAMVLDPNTGKGMIYVDGVLETSQPFTMNTVTAGNGAIFSNNGGNGSFWDWGTISNIAIWLRALSLPELKSWAGQDNNYEPRGTIAYYNSNYVFNLAKSGNLVSTWFDQSGNGFNLFQNTGGLEPVFGDRVGRRHGFTAIQKRMATGSSIDMGNSGNFQCHIVCKVTAWTTTNCSLFAFNNAEDIDFQLGAVNNGDPVIFDARISSTGIGLSTLASGVNLIDGLNHLVSLFFDAEAGTASIFIDGDLKNSSALYNGALSNAGLTSLRMFANRGYNESPEGVIGSFLVREGNDIGTFSKDVGNFGWYHSIQGQFNVDNPYKNRPPLIDDQFQKDGNGDYILNNNYPILVP